jgi:hypothetical protein
MYAPTYPPVYIEQNVPPASSGNWYYCPEPAGYYPYVGECSTAWIPVVPQSVPDPLAPLAPLQ